MISCRPSGGTSDSTLHSLRSSSLRVPKPWLHTEAAPVHSQHHHLPSIPNYTEHHFHVVSHREMRHVCGVEVGNGGGGQY